jgi:hypothetical protein
VPLDPQSDPSQDQQASNVGNTSAQPSASSPAPSSAPSSAQSQPVTQSQPTASNTQPNAAPQSSPSNPTTGTASNATTPAASPTNTPQKQPQPKTFAQHIKDSAGTLFGTLAGGPRMTYSVNPATGAVTQAERPLTRGQIGMTLAMEVIAGSLSGLAQHGPGAIGKAGEVGYEQGQKEAEQRTAAQNAQFAQAQQTSANISNSLAQKAAIMHTNMMTASAAQESEARGLDSIQKLVEMNRSAGLLSLDPDMLDGTEPITQAELVDRMSKGTLNIGDQLGPIVGAQAVTDKAGNTHYEATHLIIKNPNALVDLTPQEVKFFHDQSVQGFQGDNVGVTGRVPVRMKAYWAEQAAGNQLALQRLADLRETLAGTSLESKVPTSIDFNAPGVQTALGRYRFYQSNDAEAMNDPYVALQKMGAAKRDKDGQLQPNSDARYVNQLAQIMGGWNLLQQAHQQIAVNQKNAETYSIIDSTDKAQAVLSAPKKFSPDQVSSATNFLRIAEQQGAQKASEEARAKAIAEGTDFEQMLKTGINPISHERLTIENAPDSMLVDSEGRPVPQNQQSLYKPTGQERQTADTARQVLSISGDLQQAIQKNPALIGPLAGRSKQALAKVGVGGAEAQTLLDNVSFLQTAATKMHTGRFSNEILNKMAELIKPGMNPDEFTGALSSINAVASRYAQEDRLVTVADLKQMQNETQAQQNALSGNGGAAQRVIPKGATLGRDPKTGAVTGYKTADGTTVRF